MRRGLVVGSVSLLAAVGIVAVPAALSSAQTAGGGTRAIPAGGTTSIRGSAQGPDGLQQPELRPGGEEDEPGAFNRPRPGFKNGKFPKKPLDSPVVASSAVATSNPELGLSFEGLNHRDQRLANGGNQFSLEPPDQALCVGNGYTVEATNSVLRVWSTAGAPLTGVQDLNTFFGYPAQIDRTTGVVGPFLTDPVCLFDPTTRTFFLVVLTLDVTPAGDFIGTNHLDIAVAVDPSGTWNFYQLDVTDDGSSGTPVHPHCPCIGDYPHVGVDGNGFYITTNEYSFFGPEFNSAQIYAFSKRALARGDADVLVTQLDTGARREPHTDARAMSPKARARSGVPWRFQ